MPRSHQVAVQLDSTAHETLKRLAKTQGKPYAVVITQAVAALETTSGPLAPTSEGFTVYAQLDLETRRHWKAVVLELRSVGESYAQIAKTLFSRYRLTGADYLPLSASTIRGMTAI
ncbi:MAG TPA: hypothetical protein P5552_14840 [Candidatus Competibacteraceae bacterium]|nr:hypothetical protein [Candidatus Competibacteraceae bacterium]